MRASTSGQGLMATLKENNRTNCFFPRECYGGEKIFQNIRL